MEQKDYEQIKALLVDHEENLRELLKLKLEPMVEAVKKHETALFGESGINGLTGRLSKLQTAVGMFNVKLLIGAALLAGTLAQVFLN